MANVIEQIVQPASFGGQTIEMTVRSNERGPQGEQGDPGQAATINAGTAYSIDYGQQPQVMNSGTSSNATFDFYIPEGKPGAIHYTAGPGINITDDNRIEATGEAAVYWGDLVGSMSNQTDLQNALDAKQDKLTAGTNITISGSTISAKEYTAGSGLDLNGGEFSVDTNEIQPKLTAGSNIQINSNTISATDTTYSNFVGADGGYGGSAGLVPAPIATDNVNVLKGDGTWGKVDTNNISDGAVTTDKINDSAVTASKVDFSTLPGNYSYTEVDTGYTWVDGKHIFKKTVTHNPSGSHATSVNPGISNFGMLVKVEGVWTPDGSLFQPINRNAADQNTQQFNVGLGDVTGTNCTFTVGSGLQATGTAYITFYYTKSS